MNPRWAGLTAPFRWLIDAFDVGRHQPAVVVGAIVATSVIGVLPSLPPQLMALAGVTPGMAVQLLFQALAMLVGVAVTPVLTAGVYRIIDGAEQGRPVAVGQLGDGFRDGSWGPIVLCAVLGFALLVALMVVMLLTMAAVVGLDALQAAQPWLEQISALQAQAEASGQAIKPDALPAPPPGLGAAIGVMFAFLPLLTVLGLGVAWAQVSVALRGTAPVAAILGGLRAAFLNALPVLLMGAVLLLPLLLVFGLLVLVAGAIVALASLLGPVVAGVVTLAMMLAMSIVIAAVSYGYVLNGWRAACDTGAPSDAAPAEVAGFEA